MKNEITIKEIARLAGVNPSTVSRVFNRSTRYPISSEVSARIMAIAEKHRFAPHHAGHSLASKRSFKLGIVLNSLEMDFGSPHGAPILSHFIFEACRSGYHALVLPVENGDFDPQVRECIRAGHADGYWIGTDMMGTATVEELVHHRIPAVSCYQDVRPQEALSGVELFEVAMAGAFREMFESVRRRGFSEYAFFTREDAICERMRRYEHFHDGARYGVPLAEEFSYRGGRSELKMWREARRAAEEFWPRLSRHRLILCANDLMAMAVCDAARDHGLTPGREISVIGFDHLEVNPYYKASEVGRETLATFEVPRTELGREMARFLIRRIEKPGDATPPPVLEVKFIERESLGIGRTS